MKRRIYRLFSFSNGLNVLAIQILTGFLERFTLHILCKAFVATFVVFDIYAIDVSNALAVFHGRTDRFGFVDEHFLCWE